MRGEGGATEGLINHSCIVIDFLLKAVSQTLNYVFVCVCCSVRWEHRVINYSPALPKGLAVERLRPNSPHLPHTFSSFFFSFSHIQCAALNFQTLRLHIQAQ